MATTDELYQHRAETTEQIARGVDNVLRAQIYRAGVLVAPTSGTVTIVDSTSTVLVAAAAVTIVGDTATYTLTGATTAGLTRGEGWTIEWTLTFADGTTRTFVRLAALVTSRLHPPISLVDLFRRNKALDPDGDRCIHSKTVSDLDGFIDDAWVVVEGKLSARGRRPWLIMSPEALREPMLLLTQALIYDDIGGERERDRARELRDQFRVEWTDLAFAYDSDDDGRPDGGATPERAGTQSSVWLGTTGSQIAPGHSGWRR